MRSGKRRRPVALQAKVLRRNEGAGRFGPWLGAVSGLKQLRGASSWVVAFALGGIGIGLRFYFATWLDQTPFLPFFLPIVLAAFFCGWRQTAVLLVACALVAAHFFFRQQVQPANSEVAIFLRLGAFLSAGAVFVGAIAAVHGAISRLERAVRLQENLFRELQHRVANTLQVVAAMLAQTRDAMEDPDARDLVERAERRIVSMGELHRRLHDPHGYDGGLDGLLSDYLPDLFHARAVELGLDICPCPLSTDQMTLIVLLVAEAATNAAKHVFREGLGTHFDVSLTRLPDARLRLLISDDGPGMAPAVQDGRGARRLGMGIMHSLARQLGGTLQVVGPPGTMLRVDFVAEG